MPKSKNQKTYTVCTDHPDLCHGSYDPLREYAGCNDELDAMIRMCEVSGIPDAEHHQHRFTVVEVGGLAHQRLKEMV